jgi:hypothetical protein
VPDSRSYSYAQGLTSFTPIVSEGYGIVTGWGRLTENGALPHILQMVSLPLIAQSQCQPMYQRLGYAQYLNQCQLCGGFQEGGRDSCQVNAYSSPLKQRRTEGGGVQTPPKFRNFDKAEQNSQFRGIYICNNLIRIRVSFICKLSRTPDLGTTAPRSPFSMPSVLN